MCIVELAPLAGNPGSILTEMCEDPHDMHVELAHPEDRRLGMPDFCLLLTFNPVCF